MVKLDIADHMGARGDVVGNSRHGRPLVPQEHGHSYRGKVFALRPSASLPWHARRRQLSTKYCATPPDSRCDSYLARPVSDATRGRFFDVRRAREAGRWVSLSWKLLWVWRTHTPPHRPGQVVVTPSAEPTQGRRGWGDPTSMPGRCPRREGTSLAL